MRVQAGSSRVLLPRRLHQRPTLRKTLTSTTTGSYSHMLYVDILHGSKVKTSKHTCHALSSVSALTRNQQMRYRGLGWGAHQSFWHRVARR